MTTLAQYAAALKTPDDVEDVPVAGRWSRAFGVAVSVATVVLVLVAAASNSA